MGQLFLATLDNAQILAKSFFVLCLWRTCQQTWKILKNWTTLGGPQAKTILFLRTLGGPDANTILCMRTWHLRWTLRGTWVRFPAQALTVFRCRISASTKWSRLLTHRATVLLNKVFLLRDCFSLHTQLSHFAIWLPFAFCRHHNGDLTKSWLVSSILNTSLNAVEFACC